MADSTPLVQAELNTALKLLVPQITGLKGLAAAGVAVDAVNTQEAVLVTRQTLIQNALTAIAALQANGYPNVPLVTIPASLLESLEEEQAAIAAAIGMFTSASITPGTLTLTPNPDPPTKPGP